MVLTQSLAGVCRSSFSFPHKLHKQLNVMGVLWPKLRLVAQDYYKERGGQ